MNVKYLLYILIITFVNSLSPKKLPSGKPRTFVPNKENPRRDLSLISKKRINIVTKNWLENIMNHITHNKKKYRKNILSHDDLHIVTGINDLWRNIESDDKSYIYFSWEPKCEQGLNDILCIIVVKLIVEERQMIVENIIQSPFWDSQQIETTYLKKSLIDQNDVLNMSTLSFEELYKNNIRYKLSWDTWYTKI